MRARPALRLPAMVVWLAGASLAGPPLPAQVIRGRLLDDKTDAPIGQASVVLRDTAGVIRAAALTDSTGFFLLQAPGAGSYTMRARRIGYLSDTSPPLALGTGQVLELDFAIAVRPVVLPAVTVQERRLRAARARRTAGLDERALGARLIPPEKIRAQLPRVRSVADLLRSQNIPGVWLDEDQSGGICVRLVRGRVSTPLPARGRSGAAGEGTPEGIVPGEVPNSDDRRGCVAMYLDDAPFTFLEDLDPGDVEKMILLLPNEAGALYGTGASQGVLLIYSRGSMR